MGIKMYPPKGDPIPVVVLGEHQAQEMKTKGWTDKPPKKSTKPKDKEVSKDG